MSKSCSQLFYETQLIYIVQNLFISSFNFSYKQCKKLVCYMSVQYSGEKIELNLGENVNRVGGLQIETKWNQQNVMIFADDVILAAINVEQNMHQNLTCSFFLRPTGAFYQFPILYLSVFQEMVRDAQIYKLKAYPKGSYFGVFLELKLNPEGQQIKLSKEQQDYAKLCIYNFNRFLVLIGQKRLKGKFSLQANKMLLKFKKDLMKKLAHSPDQSIEEQRIQEEEDKSTSIIEVLKVVQKQTNEKHPTYNVKSGGYFTVERKRCQVSYLNGQIDKGCCLAVKKIRPNRLPPADANQKLLNQLNFIRRIKQKDCLVKYYIERGVQNHFYMQFIENNLKELIYDRNQTLAFNEMFSLIKQLLKAILNIHRSGVVHRDIKLDNILIQKNKTNGEKTLKIIDFGQSALIGIKQQKNPRLGCTIPYSPIECMLEGDEGINNLQIDLWSIIVVMYEIIFKRLPLFYCRSMKQEIISGWKAEEGLMLNLRMSGKRGIRKIEQYFCLLTEHGLKIEQKQRLKISKINNFIQSLQIFYNQMIENFKRKV